MTEITLIISSFPSIESARAASAVLLETKQVACCNLQPNTESHYWWEGKLTSSAEVMLMAKTTAANAAQAQTVLRAHHPYTCPEILSLAAVATADYAAWVAANVDPAAPPQQGG
jgi:periplasmic divalent cation tolerance protein